MIKRNFTRVICLMISAIFMIGVCGCMNTSTNNPKFTVDEILQYMNEKYGEEFTYIEPVDVNQPTASSFSIFVENESYPDKKIYAKCLFNTDTGEKQFCDNYVSFMYEDDVRTVLTELSQEVYGDAKVRYALNDTAASSDSTEDIPSLEQYLSRTSSAISYMILLPDEHDEALYKEELEALRDALKKKKVVCSITIAYSKDRAQYDSFVTDKWTNEHVVYKLRGDVRIGEDFEIKFEEWR